jgi:hypothetical protein
MSVNEFAGEMRAAASNLVIAASATENGNLRAAEAGVEDALFRVESLLSRLQIELNPKFERPPNTTGEGWERS